MFFKGILHGCDGEGSGSLGLQQAVILQHNWKWRSPSQQTLRTITEKRIAKVYFLVDYCPSYYEPKNASRSESIVPVLFFLFEINWTSVKKIVLRCCLFQDCFTSKNLRLRASNPYRFFHHCHSGRQPDGADTLPKNQTSFAAMWSKSSTKKCTWVRRKTQTIFCRARPKRKPVPSNSVNDKTRSNKGSDEL